MYTRLQPISATAYATPAQLIEYQGDPITDPDEIAAELDAAEYKGAVPTVVAAGAEVRGWEDYTEIIRCTDEHGEDRYYLAY